MNPEISVIVATRNEEDKIGPLIDSLKNQTQPPTEILVVDGNSTDSTRDVAEEHGATVIPETGENRSPSNAWNIGVEEAEGNVVFLLGGDFLIEDESLMEKVVPAFEDDDVVGVYPEISPTTDTLFKKITGVSGKAIQPMFIRRDAFLEVGGYPVMGYGEEMVLTHKLEELCAEEGKKMPYIKDAHVGGHPVSSPKELFWQAEWYGRSAVPFIKRFKKEFGTAPFAKQCISISLRSIYTLTLVLAIYGLFTNAPVLGIPFAAFFTAIVLKNIRHPPRVLKTLTNIVYGTGYIYGLIRYALGDKRLGRS